MATATKNGHGAPRVVTENNGATLIAAPGKLTPASKLDPRTDYICPECGHVLRVSGLGRHRVYFELDDGRSDNPVMNRVCPTCSRGLPGKNRL